MARAVGVRELASLWAVPAIRDHLMVVTSGPGGPKGSLSMTLSVLRAHGGQVGGSLADALERFPYRKGHWTVRALLQNSSTLSSHGYSFRSWLRHECSRLGVVDFPPTEFRRPVTFAGRRVSLEEALRLRLEEVFFRVGPAMAPYMICDWQLWLWRNGLTEVFASFKWDQFHDQFVRRYGRGVVPVTEQAFVRWWFSMYPDLPPRLANEAIWLGTENKVV
jgi:hypothetical protein